MTWNELTSIEQFDQLRKEKEFFAVFKHSTRCSISSMIKSRLEHRWDFPEEQIPVYYLDLLKYRNVSDHIAHACHVIHESPQLIIFREGNVVHHASHNMVMVESLREAFI